jgi:hypothetical protein
MSLLYNIFKTRTLKTGTSEIIPITDLPNIYRSIPNQINNIFEFNISNRETRVSILLSILTINLIYPIFSRLFFGCIGFIFSYHAYYKFGALKSGDPSFGMMKFSNGIHIHHWMYCTGGLIILWGLGMDNPFAIGLCFGGITHGIQFNDWCKTFDLERIATN